MEDTSRRELFKILGSSIVLTTAGSGVLSPVLGQLVHAEISAVKSLSRGPKSAFSVPKEAVDYAVKRSPFANEG